MGSTRSAEGPLLSGVALRGSHTPLVGGTRVACPLDQLTERVTVVDGVALVRRGRSVHAFAATCPHGAASLADGAVRGGAVTCPRHGARFRLRDGRALAGPTRTPLAVLATVVQDGVVQVLDRAPARRPVPDRVRDVLRDVLKGAFCGQRKHDH